MKIILKWSAREEQAISGLKSANVPGEQRRFIFEAVSLINDEVVPRKLVEDIAVVIAHFVSGYADVPLAIFVFLSRTQHIIGDTISILL